MIKFQELSIEGFGTYIQPFSFSLDRPGINLIKGKNGAGKTTMWSAFIWCLYGQNLKDVKAAQLQTFDYLRPKTWIGTRVMLTLSVNSDTYLIARHIKYKGLTEGYKGDDKLMIYKNGTQVSDGLYLADQQKYLNSVIGLDFNMFTNTVVFGQKMTRLIDASSEEKRRIFEELSGSSFIPTAREKGKLKIDEITGKISQIDLSISKLSYEIKSVEAELNSVRTIIADAERAKASRLADIKSNIDSITANVSKTQAELDSMPEVIIQTNDELEANYQKVLTKQAELSSAVSRANSLLSSKQSEESSLLSQLATSVSSMSKILTDCPTCGAPLSDIKVDAMKLKFIDEQIRLNANISTTKTDIVSLQDALSAAKTELSNFLPQIEDLRNALAPSKELVRAQQQEAQKRVECASRLRSLKESLERYIKDYERELLKPLPVDNSQELSDKLTGLRLQISKLESDKPALITTKEHLDWWVQKGFGASGLKMYIFNSLLSKVNAQIAQYAARLGVKVKFSVDLQKTSKPFVTEVYKNDTIIDYDCLSGGEKQKIDICLAFAMYDVISATNETNILILDEVLESVDDYGGTEDVFDLIRHKAGSDKSIFVITHNKGVDTLYSREIFIDSDSGESNISA